MSKLVSREFLLSLHLRDSHNICMRCRHMAFWPWSSADSTVFTKNNTNWNKAVSDAEKIVGYPTSFMSLRCLLSDEISNVAMLMRKLVGTKHPLLRTARGLVYDGKYSMQTRGLIVLLISKAAGRKEKFVENQHHRDQDFIGGIHKSQRALAEIIEMIYTANLIHKGVVNLDDIKPEDGTEQDMEFGNKMAVLSGDFLLANACTGLAELNNTKVVENVSKAIGDLMEAEFSDLKDKHGNPVLHKDVQFSDWQQQTFLSSGSLLAKSCQSALQLGNHKQEFQDAAHQFGENITYAHQLQEDMKPFLNPDEYLHEMTATCAPIIRCLSHKSSVFDLVMETETKELKKIADCVKSCSALEECKSLCMDYGNKAKTALEVFSSSQAKEALVNMVNATLPTT